VIDRKFITLKCENFVVLLDSEIEYEFQFEFVGCVLNQTRNCRQILSPPKSQQSPQIQTTAKHLIQS